MRRLDTPLEVLKTSGPYAPIRHDRPNEKKKSRQVPRTPEEARAGNQNMG
jgi:hypothetical protein